MQLTCKSCGGNLEATENKNLFVCPYCGKKELIDTQVEAGTKSVILTELGRQKIAVIKVVREVTNYSLKVTKELVESTPSTVKSGLSDAEALDLKTQLENAGANAKIIESNSAVNNELIDTQREAGGNAVILKEIGRQKIQVIKVIRQATNYSLNAANDLMEAAPSIVKRGLSYTAALDLKTQLENAGATAEVIEANSAVETEKKHAKKPQKDKLEEKLPWWKKLFR